MRLWVIVALLVGSVAVAAEPTGHRNDAAGLEPLINRQYAYLDRLPGERFTLTPKLREEAKAVDTRQHLIRFAERSLMLLADHHSITGASLKDSWAVFPSYGDMWVDRQGRFYVIEEVREDSPAERAGIRAGDRLLAVGGAPIGEAVHAFWRNLGAIGGGERDSYAARVLAAGRRDRPRSIAIQSAGGPPRVIELANLYSRKLPDRPPVTTRQQDGTLIVRFNDSLGDRATVGAFDSVMAKALHSQKIVLDLTDTPSGGNTTIARGIIGWFVAKPTAYQVHNLPVEERNTGVPRQWIEQALPRAGKYHPGPVTVRVGRWTGSMGEGLALGLRAAGARVEGSQMAGLLGAIYDHALPASGLVLKIPTERLYAVDGTPREKFIPGALQTSHQCSSHTTAVP